MTGSTVPWTNRTLEFHIGDVDVHTAALVAPTTDDAYAERSGGEPVVFLHGFGSTKEEYADFTTFPGLAGRAFVAYDAPGFGASTATDLDVLGRDIGDGLGLVNGRTSRLSGDV